MPTVYRIVKTKYARTAFDGEGAYLRWALEHTRHADVFFTRRAVCLAALEMLVHLDDDELLLAYSFVAAAIPGLDFAHQSLVPCAKTGARRLRHWPYSVLEMRVCGNASAVLEVPTSIVPLEHNYLLNPEHPDYAQITLQKPRAFSFL